MPWPLYSGAAEANEAQAMCAVAMRVQQQRHAAALIAAQDAGYWHGERVGYVQGWSWGVICGAIIGVLIAAALTIGALMWHRSAAPTAEQLLQLLIDYPGETIT